MPHLRHLQTLTPRTLPPPLVRAAGLLHHLHDHADGAHVGGVLWALLRVVHVHACKRARAPCKQALLGTAATPCRLALLCTKNSMLTHTTGTW